MHDPVLQISVFLPQAPGVFEREGGSWPESNNQSTRGTISSKQEEV
jgi:hypothetical protein